jgi:hypothetical protein
MKQRFFEQYEILRTTRCSLVVVNKQTQQKCFISHHAFNILDRATDMRETEIENERGKFMWVEIAIWQR